MPPDAQALTDAKKLLDNLLTQKKGKPKAAGVFIDEES